MQCATFEKSKRLLTAADYKGVFDASELRASHRNLLLLAVRNDRGEHRLGLVIAKKNVRLAVQRNRVKRLAREVFRQLPPADVPLDVVMLTRRGIDQLDNERLSTILRQQWRKLLDHASTLESSTPRNSECAEQ